MRKLLRSKSLLLFALLLGGLSGVLGSAAIIQVASLISELFINLLKLVSLPIIFLSLVSTSFRFDNIHELKFLGTKVLKYTFLTTIVAAMVALGVYLLINPADTVLRGIQEQTAATSGNSQQYLHYLKNIIPTNIVQPFLEGNVISVFFMGVILCLGLLSLPQNNRDALKPIVMGFYQTILNITVGILYLLPFGMWAFVTLFVHELHDSHEIEQLILYVGCVVLANIIQACIVLPLLLKSKGIAPVQLFKHMLPALTVAFFSKSSAAALPVALQAAKKRAGISEKISNFSLPLCTTINMNACAAFILITVLFISMSHGMTFNAFELFVWIFIATIAAIGNASVPMGCYFLATSLLIAIGVPVQMMAIILPVYTLIDMLESAINVWSDCCVTAVVDKEVDLQAEKVGHCATKVAKSAV